ncbi:MAG: response regulator [Bacteroidia bacterium]
MKKILIAEDELIIAKVYSRVLQKEGYEVKNVATGKDAQQLFEEFKPDVAVLDIQLKGNLTGIDVAQHIRKTSNIPLVFTTGNSAFNTQKEITEFKNTHLLSKPVDYNIFIQLIKSL